MIEESILTGVSSVGFPIVAYVLMWRFARDTVQQNTKAIQELQQEVRNLHE